jgi:hypothetical protein
LAQVALFEDDASLDTPYMRALREATPFTSAAEIRAFAELEVVGADEQAFCVAQPHCITL